MSAQLQIRRRGLPVLSGLDLEFDRLTVAKFGQSRLLKGGDMHKNVLTGILAGMAAQFGPAHWERALALGIYLHGLAADDATTSRAEASLLSGEIADHLPETYRRFVVELQQRG